jgi:hypothetical protein
MFKGKFQILALSVTLTLLMGFQCGKDSVSLPKQHFLEKVHLEPAQKKYNVGDTIWLKYETSDKTFLDTVSGQRLQTHTLKFWFGASLLPKYQAPLNPPDGFCDFILPTNVTARYITNQSGTSTFFEVECDSNPVYNIEIGIVLKYTGIYVLNLPDAINTEACINQINPYPSSFLRFIYSLTDCNKDVYLSIPAFARNENPGGFTEAQITSKVAYAINVQ